MTTACGRLAGYGRSAALAAALMLGGGLAGCATQPAAQLKQAATPAAVVARQPNILLIVADDLGYSDLGAFGGEIRTPNLDRLAHQGIRLSNFYTAPTCSPTRAMLLSGRDNHEVGLGTMAEVLTPAQRGKPGYEGYLSRDVETVAAALGKRGYQTMMSGKWHLGLDADHSPQALGFEHSYALLQGAANHFGTDQGGAYEKAGRAALYREGGALVRYPEGQYSSDYFTDRMIGYLQARDPAKPFFAYVAYTDPHWPMQAPADDIARYRGQYDDGPAALRVRRVERMKALGLIPNTLTPGRFAFTDWQRLSADDRAIEARKMEIYAAMVDRLDRNIGRLIETLRASGQLDNTVIVFLSDNGPDELNLTVPIDVTDPTKAIGAPVDNSLANLGAASSYVSYGEDWAHASAAPLAGTKASTAEGGIRTPAFIWGVGVAGGRTNGAPLHVLDIYPTLLDLADRSHRQAAPAALEGISWAPFLAGGKGPVGEPRALNWEFVDRRAARLGRWKALYVPTPLPILRSRDDRDTVAWELYDMQTDPGETRNLAAQHPVILRRLIRQWQTYAERVGVVQPAYATGDR